MDYWELYNKIQAGKYDSNSNATFESFKKDVLKTFNLQDNEKGETLFAIAFEISAGKGKTKFLEKMHEIYNSFKVVRDYFEKGECANEISYRNQTDRRCSSR